MLWKTCLVVACVVLGASPARAEPERWTLDRILEAAQLGPRNRAAGERTEEARGQRAEARGLRFPRLGVTGIVAPSPRIECDDPTCTQTSPEEASVDFEGVFARIEVSLVQPLFTFGKLDAASDAARHAVEVAESLEDVVAGDVAVAAARAYYGLKLSRETRWMLEDGRETLDDALKRVNDKLKAGSADVTLQDRYRLEVLMSEVDLRLADARQGEATALAGIRALVGDDSMDVDQAPLEVVEYELEPGEDYATRARDALPEVKAATAGKRAIEELARLESRRYLPDLLLVGRFTYAHAGEVDDPPSAFANDPYNTTSAGLAVAVRWTLDPIAQPARVRRAEARSRRAQHLLDALRDGAEFQAHEVYQSVVRAGDRVEVAKRGAKSARAWLAATLQADAVGTAESKDLADAYLAFFTARGNTLSAIYDWDVAVFSLRRVTGEFTAKSPVQSLTAP